MPGRRMDRHPSTIDRIAKVRGPCSETRRILFNYDIVNPAPAIGHRPEMHTCPLHPPVIWKLCRDTSMESRMGRCVRGRVFRYIVQARGTESSDGTVGHCLATRNRSLIFEIEHRIGFRRSMKAFGVPSCSVKRPC